MSNVDSMLFGCSMLEDWTWRAAEVRRHLAATGGDQ